MFPVVASDYIHTSYEQFAGLFGGEKKKKKRLLTLLHCHLSLTGVVLTLTMNHTKQEQMLQNFNSTDANLLGVNARLM